MSSDVIFFGARHWLVMDGEAFVIAQHGQAGTW